MGRTGSRFARHQLPIELDTITGGEGLGAGYADLAVMLCADHVYQALPHGSRKLEHGHTWDGAPLPCAVGLAVPDTVVEHGPVEGVRSRGSPLRDELGQALAGWGIVKEVRGRGFPLGVQLIDPRDGESFLPDELDVASLVDQKAFGHGLLVTSTDSIADGYTGDRCC